VITPRLYRRSLGRALQVPLLLFWVAGALLPAAIAVLPFAQILSELLDRSPRAGELVIRLDSGTLADVLRKLPGSAPALRTGATVAIVVSLLVAPALAGAALAAARSDGRLGIRALLAGAGEHYGRLFRIALLGTVPLGVAAAASGALFGAARRSASTALTESQAVRGGRLALAGALVLLFVAQLTLDAGRAFFAAQPHRRSAVLAWWSGVRLVARQPLRSAGLGAIALAAGGVAAAVLLLVRLRVPQSGPGTVLVAFLLGELATAALGWNRAARLFGFTELARADLAERERRAAEEGVRPPDGSLSPPAPSGTQPPLATPR
jgi:hypothetical protein